MFFAWNGWMQNITQWHSLALNPSAPFVFPWTYFPYKNQFCLLCCYVKAQTNVRKLTDRLYRQSREPDCVQGCQVHKVNKRIDLCNFFSLISFNYNSYFRHYLWRKAQHNVKCVLDVKSLISFDKFVSLINFIITIRSIKPEQPCVLSNCLKGFAS